MLVHLPVASSMPSISVSSADSRRRDEECVDSDSDRLAVRSAARVQEARAAGLCGYAQCSMVNNTHSHLCCTQASLA